MSMSIDGFIAGPADDDDHPLGVDGGCLLQWLDHRNTPGASDGTAVVENTYLETVATRR
jgi:hypothetical protein